MQREIGEEGSELSIKRIATGGTAESSEEEMLQGFFNIIESRLHLSEFLAAWKDE